FPILDLKGRVIAFGGRALEKDVPAKYLNSPETPLFHKGATLFNASRARAAAHDKDRVIVVEATWTSLHSPKPASAKRSHRSERPSPRIKSSCSGDLP